jgi:hypothetical protein
VSEAADRRQAERDHQCAGTVRVRPGYDTTIVNLSTCGVLVETRHRLLPGHWLDMRMQVHGQTRRVRGLVMRSSIWTLASADAAYRAGIMFEYPQAWAGDTSGSGYP